MTNGRGRPKRYRPLGGGIKNGEVRYSPYGTGCPAVEEAVAGLYRDKDEESFWTLMSALNYALEMETQVLVPVNDTPAALTPPTAWVKRPIPAEKGRGLPLWFVYSTNGSRWLPLFTSAASVTADRGTAFRPVIEMPLQAALNKALDTDGIDGVVLDPWQRSASLDKSLLRGLLRAGHDSDAGEAELDAGRAAAAKGSWDDAAERYSRAAQAGNTDGLTQLAYCFYLGRGVRRSRAEARKLWKLAADNGSVNALIALGDDCLAAKKELGRPLKYYRMAQSAARRQPDIAYMPEVCLRMAQAETGFITGKRQQAAALTAEAIHGFKIRHKAGDPDAAAWLAEAEETMQRLTQAAPSQAAYKESLQMD